jgi:hypothetical protein
VTAAGTAVAVAASDALSDGCGGRQKLGLGPSSRGGWSTDVAGSIELLPTTLGTRFRIRLPRA